MFSLNLRRALLPPIDLTRLFFLLPLFALRYVVANSQSSTSFFNLISELFSLAGDVPLFLLILLVECQDYLPLIPRSNPLRLYWKAACCLRATPLTAQGAMLSAGTAVKVDPALDNLPVSCLEFL